MPRLLKWFGVFCVIALLLFGIHVYDRMTHCTGKGLERKEALRIANEKLKIDFRGNEEFSLEKDQFEADRGWWTFTFRLKECTVKIIIDNCGASDIGGITEACVSRQR